MAFDLDKFGRNSSTSNEDAPIMWTYNSGSDAIATVLGSAYFNSISGRLSIGDLMYVKASDQNELIEVTAVSPNVTTIAYSTSGTLSLAEGNIYLGNASNIATATDAKTSGQLLVGNGTTLQSVALSGDATLASGGALTIANNAVELAMLAAGITPSHVVKFGAQYTTTGGAAAEAITVTGALATDIAFVQLKSQGATPRTVDFAAVTADTLTVTFSGDPSTDHVIYYQILRAAA